MRHRKETSLASLAIAFLLATLIQACSLGSPNPDIVFSQTTWNLPDNRKNTRFTSDHFNIARPALSMRSFDNTKNDNYQHQYSSTTYGVRQVLEKAYGIGQNQDLTVAIPFEEILA